LIVQKPISAEKTKGFGGSGKQTSGAKAAGKPVKVPVKSGAKN
jgi:hypothetical protein